MSLTQCMTVIGVRGLAPALVVQETHILVPTRHVLPVVIFMVTLTQIIMKVSQARGHRTLNIEQCRIDGINNYHHIAHNYTVCMEH